MTVSTLYVMRVLYRIEAVPDSVCTCVYISSIMYTCKFETEVSSYPDKSSVTPYMLNQQHQSRIRNTQVFVYCQ